LSPVCMYAMKLKPLPERFRYDNFDFRMLKREGDIAIFAKSSPSHPREPDSYEVVRVQRKPARLLFGRDIPAHEAMPASEDWGIHGWTYAKLEAAEKKFAELINAS
jgi:hypothetical protein